MSEQTNVQTSAGQAAKAGLFGALGVMSAPILVVIIILVLCCGCFSVMAMMGSTTTSNIPNSSPTASQSPPKQNITSEQVLKGLESKYKFEDHQEDGNYIGVDMERNSTIQILGDESNVLQVGLVYILDNNPETSQNVESTSKQVIDNIFDNQNDRDMANKWITQSVVDITNSNNKSRETVISNNKIKVEVYTKDFLTLRIDFYL